MRKIVILSFVSLDGVMQAPGGPQEDTSGGFKLGGWTVPYFDDFAGKIMIEQMKGPFDLLLGRKTYEIFASYWPFQDTRNNPIAAGINKARKYVASTKQLELKWKDSILLTEDVAGEIRKIKMEDSPDLQVHGSSNLTQTLLRNDLVDELWLKIFPVTLGSGKRLFGEENSPKAFALRESVISPKGVIIASYVREGEVRTGPFAS
jgi:dihydrofolate reductase